MTGAVDKPRQIPLDLPWPRHDRASRADFTVSDSNAEAVQFLAASQKWPDGRLALVGPEGCGKTHLALIWAQENGAVFVEDGADPRALAAKGCVVFEDCDRRVTTEESEFALFHLLNILREEGGRILMTARTPPARWPVKLRDLVSRLSSVTVAAINSPDDELLERLVIKLFADRDVAIKATLATYIATRIDRSSAAIEAAVAALDARSIELRQPVSQKMAREMFGW